MTLQAPIQTKLNCFSDMEVRRPTGTFKRQVGCPPADVEARLAGRGSCTSKTRTNAIDFDQS